MKEIKGAMMRSGKRERWVRFVSVNLGVSPESRLVGQVSLKKLIAPIKTAMARKEQLQRKPRDDAKRHVRLVDVCLTSDKKYAVFLFRLIDKDAIDVTYEDFKNGTLEPHPKSETQGNRVTAHLLIRLKPQHTGGRKRYPALLEETTGLGAGRVEDVLNSLAHKFGRGNYKNASGKEDTYTCKIEVRPKVVGTIRDELKRGVLKGFTLVHSFAPQQINDETIHIEDRKKRLEVAVVGANVRDKIDDVWKVVRAKANKEEYELVKASYENTDGRVTSVDMEARRADALEELVTKTKKIELDCDANYDQQGVFQPIIDKMISALGTT